MKETTDHDIPFRCPLTTTNENANKKRGRKEIVMQIVFNNDEQIHNNNNNYSINIDTIKNKLKKYDVLFI